MFTRRQALKVGGCALCAASLPHAASGQPADIDDQFFYCGTTQITNATGVDLFSATGGASVDLGRENSTASLDPYATAQRSLRWTKASTGVQAGGRPLVLIGFVDGTPAERDKVRMLAQEWLEHDIGVAFEFIDDLRKTHVRIGFSGGTNKSKTGTEALRVAKSAATMFLPAVRNGSNDTVKRRAVLHEFGHGIMTFGHEHRHANAGYVFKDARIIRDLINQTLPVESRWTVDMVEQNITNPPYAASRSCSNYDVTSIMHYPVQASWLVHGVPVPQPATTLSKLDVGCAAEIYKL
jgi:hypothetical protein